MSKAVILVIEDDASIRRGVVDALLFEGYETIEAENADTGRERARRAGLDLILLDLVLPRGDGLDILAQVRRDRPTLPVIILTARGGEAERVNGLKLGADDYVVKPFSVKELLARVQAVLRRSPARPLDVKAIDFPGGSADLAAREVRFDDGGRNPLSEREVELLRYLAVNSGRAISRDELLSGVSGLNPRAIVETRTIDMHVARLREKLRDDPDRPRIIVTVRGKGYRLDGGGA